jgi:hypothetical protein
MRRRIAVILLPVPIAVVIAAPMAQNASQYRPYEIRTVLSMTSESRAATRPARIITRIFFGRADGSRGARTIDVLDGRSCTSTAYWDERSHLKVISDECTQLKSTEPYTRLPGSPGPMMQSCEKVLLMQLEGTELIHGLRVEKFTHDGPSARATTYAAPELGCLAVRSVYFWKDPSGKVTGTTIDEPVEVKLSEPDPRLFETPPTSRESLPSDRRKALIAFFGGNPQDACLRRGNELEDARYLSARSEKLPAPGQRLFALLRERTEAAISTLRASPHQHSDPRKEGGVSVSPSGPATEAASGRGGPAGPPSR